MIQDYKLNKNVRRPGAKGRLRISAAIGVLVATFSTVKFLDLNAAVDPSHGEAPAFAVSLPLALPAVAEQSQPTARMGEASDAAAAAVLQAATPMAIAQPEPVSVAPAPSLLADAAPAAKGANDVPQIALAPSAPQARPQWSEYIVASGDSLAAIFSRQGLDAPLLHRIVNSSQAAKSLAQIRPGQRLRFLFDENHELNRLELHRNRVESIRVAIADDEISVEEISKAVDTRVSTAAGVIESSLFVDGQKAGLSDGQIMELATIFGWDIDFALEIRAGDQFRVLFEEHYLDGEKLRDGHILAAEFTNRGTTHRAVRYEDVDGEVGYFDADGHSKRRAFIRTPIKFARVSSRYNPRRWHPVLKKWRSHKGVDYAAPTGTPVRAAGDGRVVFRGTKGGYGKTVIVEHASKYTTLYAHLSNYSKRSNKGNRVKQGQVIGYVGKTGLASGPHLHYEFRVNGQHRDPLRVKLPKSLALPKSEIAKFRKTAAPLLAQLEAIQAGTMVASAEANPTKP